MASLSSIVVESSDYGAEEGWASQLNVRQLLLVCVEDAQRSLDRGVKGVPVEREAVTYLGRASNDSAKTKRGEHTIVVIWLNDHSHLLDGGVILISWSEVMQRAALGRITVRSGEVDCNSERDLNTTSKVVNKCWNLNQLKVSELNRSTAFYNAVTASVNKLVCRCNDMTDLFWSTHQSKFDAKCWITV